jgi:hypothetical protein
LFSDILGDASEKWFSKAGVLYEDSRTKMTAISVELTGHLKLPARRELVHSSETHPLGNHIYKIIVKIESNKLSPPTTATIFYAFCENTSLANYLIATRAHVSHLIRVRYGNGMGGSAASGAWLINILQALRTECLISDKIADWYYDKSVWREADYFAVQNFRRIPNHSNSQLDLMDIIKWAGRNTFWYEVS